MHASEKFYSFFNFKSAKGCAQTVSPNCYKCDPDFLVQMVAMDACSTAPVDAGTWTSQSYYNVLQLHTHSSCFHCHLKIIMGDA